MPYRIGIDVGGTFTHAVAVEAETLRVTAQAKVPTTHRAAEGVALGVTQALRGLLEAGVRPEEIIFIAHSTTQATNALLEGDVAPVGIIGMARGADALKARADTEIGRLEVAPGRFLETYHTFLGADAATPDTLRAAVEALRGRGAQVIVGAEAFGVDDPTNERLLLEVCAGMEIPATASHEVSGLYGLRIRTRTAVINASILPKMVQTARMTAHAVAEAGISAPLMIMRSDGGVMSIDEMRRRPILTILSGPAAGVAAALMYAKISDGIFVEVGGTSSDITCIRNGQAAVQSATLGGHKLFLRTLDVRTIGLAGGSMVRVKEGTVVAVGPRSAHLAGLAYSCFAQALPPSPAGGEGWAPATIQPLANDPADYLIAVNGDARLALTMSCAANAAGYVPEGDYARGDGALAARVLADALRSEPAAAAEQVLASGCAQAVRTVETLLQDYGVPREHVTLIGGGGGAGAVVPYTGTMMDLPWRIAENAPVISAIGVALALVRDTVERTIPNPSREDLLRVRQEAVEAVTRMGAAPDTIEVQVEVDPQHQIVRATASGATELRARDRAGAPADAAAQARAAAASLGVTPAGLRELARTPHFAALGAVRETKKLFGLIKTVRLPARLVDAQGVIRLQLTHADAAAVAAGEASARLRAMIDAQAHYGDGGERLPAVFLAAGPRIFNLSGLLSAEHILSLADAELRHLPADQPVLLVVGEQS
ncbi:MAG TPA: hydantoinase/oxoprolinase family protein [Armatimonadota bacterium]|nr:hydantoinase/oxoprolinase family protein [Armatimonadota bacterium]